MSDSEWGARTRTGVVWSTAAFVGGRVLTFISTLILARLLTPAEFGVVAAVVVFASTLEVIGDLGMKATVIYEQEQGTTDRLHTAFTLNLIVAVVLAGLGVALAPLIASFFNATSETGLFRLGALSLLLVGLGNIHDAILLRNLAFRARLVPDILRSIARASTSITMALIGFGAISLIAGLLVGSAVWTMTLWLRGDFRPRLSLDRAIARSMLGYGGAAALLELVSALGDRTGVYVVGRVLGAQALGLYTVASRIPELAVTSVAWNVSRVAFPALSQQRTEDSDKIGAGALTLVRYQALYALPMAAGIAVLATPLVLILLGPAWLESAGVMAALAVLAGLAAVLHPIGDIFKALGKQRMLVIITLFESPISVAAIILLAPSGIVAVAWGMATLQFFVLITRVHFASRMANVGFRALVSAAFPGAVAAAGVLLGAGAVRLGLDAPAGVVVVAGGLSGMIMSVAGLRLLRPADFDAARRQLHAIRGG